MCAKSLCGLALSMLLCCVLDSSHARADETENLLPKVVAGWETRKRLPVFEPDGSPANKDVQFVAGPRFARFEIGEALEIVGRVGFLEGNGDLLIDFDDKVEFVAIISEKGFFHFAVSRLKFLESIRLQPWSQLDVTDLANRRAEDGNSITVTSVLTTDAMHQGLMMVRRGVTDREGRAHLDHIIPGENSIAAKSMDGRHGGAGADREVLFIAESGATVSMLLGASTRIVTGTVEFPPGERFRDFDVLRGRITSKTSNESMTFTMDAQGHFEASRVPTGECELEIRTRNPGRTQKYFYATLNFLCSSNGSEVYDVGVLELMDIGSASTAQEPTPVKPLPPEDEFVSHNRVALVCATKGAGAHYVFLDEQGKQVRELKDILTPIAWASANQYVAFDTERDRVYLLSAGRPSDGVQSLFAFDLTGKLVYSIQLPMGACRVAVDKSTGEPWVLHVHSIGDSEITVFDFSGNPFRNKKVDAFTLNYSVNDEAMWTVGSKDVKKLDLDSCEELASYKFPTKIFALTDVVAHSSGGVVAMEFSHPDLPYSFNRLWRFDSNAEPIASVDIGSIRPSSSSLIRDEFWMCGSKSNSYRKLDRHQAMALRFTDTLEWKKTRDLSGDAIAGAGDGTSVWLFGNNELKKISLDDQGKLNTTLVTEFPYGHIWGPGN